MKNNIHDILQELYKIDSSLQTKEEDLKKTLQHFLELKPNIVVDEAFKNELQSQIQQKILQQKVQKFSQNKPSFFQIFSYIFGTVGLACFGFILVRENISFTAKPLAVPVVEKKITSLSNQEALTLGDASVEVVTSESMVNYPPETASKKERVVTNEASKDQEIYKKEVVTQENTVTESLGEEKIIAFDDVAGAMSDMSMMADEVPQESMGLMKSTPMMAEYVQDVYVYSFSGELNLNFEKDFETYKKRSNESVYFSPEKLALETKKDNILKVALVGGKDGFEKIPESTKKREISVVLKNPKIAYTNVYHYAGGQSQSYFAPSVIFEVEKTDNPQVYQTEIVVPLVKEIYEYDGNGNIIGVSQE